MLLYQVKHSCPKLANMTSELSKANNSANPATYKEVLYVIRYLLGTENYGLKIKPTGNFNENSEIFCFSNSDYTGDPVSRQSMWLHTFCTQCTSLLAIQVMEKYFPFQFRGRVYTETVKEVMFIVQLLESM